MAEQPGTPPMPAVQYGQSHKVYSSTLSSRSARKRRSAGLTASSCTAVCDGCVVTPTEPSPQNLEPVDRVDRVDEVQPGLRTIGHRDGDHVVECHHRRRRDRNEKPGDGDGTRLVRRSRTGRT